MNTTLQKNTVLASKGMGKVLTTLPPTLPYAKWRVTLNNGDVVVRKYLGTQADVLNDISDAVSATPIGKPVYDH